MAKLKAVFVVGTRPDAIKSAPVVQEFLRLPDLVETTLISTGQHKEMLSQALEAFGLKADHDLAVMMHGQSLASVTSKILDGLDGLFTDLLPDIVFAQGDTTTTFVAGLASFYKQIPFAHIEAGLRTETVWDPFPEEFNRRAVGLFAALHFPPTTWSAENLIREGVDASSIFVTGNTGIDAVRAIAQSRVKTWFPDHTGRVILLTTHRRENWGEPQKRIAEAALEVVQSHSDLLLVVPMHRNPEVRKVLEEVLGHDEQVKLIEPPDYPDFVKLLERSSLALTDSGGIQEEAPTFGVPVLVMRETTERPEGVEAGTARLVGTDKDKIVRESMRLLTDQVAYESMAKSLSPYGDGKAASRIRFVTLRHFGIDSQPETMWN